MSSSRIERDEMIFIMGLPELFQVAEDRGLLSVVYANLVADLRKQVALGRRVPKRPPIRVYIHEKGKVYIVSCNVSVWRYFSDVEAINPSEKKVRKDMVLLGEMGKADEILRQYPAGN